MKQNSRSNKFESESETSSKIFNTIRKDWHFNLRRINTNRANYLDYKQQQQQLQAIAGKQDDLTSELLIKKEKLDLDLQHANDLEFDQRLASINLINTKPYELHALQLNSSKSNEETQTNQFDYADFPFDLSKSLVDQVNKANSNRKETENSETISIPNENTIQKLNLAKYDNLVKEEHKCLPTNVCVYEYLNKTNSQCVPNECFQHVALYLKQSKYINIQTSTSTFKNTFFKCEYIYGENFYWIVKLKRFTNKLYQIKFIRNIPPQINSNFNSTKNESDLNESDLPPTPSSPCMSLNSSLTRTNEDSLKLNNFFIIDTNSKLNIFNHFRPLGWSKSNGRQALKPNDFSPVDSFQSNEEFFKLMPNTDLYENASYCELQTDLSVHICKIKRNVSGRLLVEHDNVARWIYYLDPRLHSLGWARSTNLTYLNQIDNLDMSESGLLKSNEIEPRQRHHFKQNYLMECLYQNKFYVARVVEILNDNCFKLELDAASFRVKLTFYTNNSTVLFPCRWCAQNNFKLELPSDWPSEKEFDWDTYCADLSRKHGEQYSLTTDLNLFNWSRNLAQQSEKFQIGMYLECVDPFTKVDNQENGAIYLAQIKAKLAHLIFVKLVKNYSNLEEQLNDESFLVYPIDSFDLFPIGWCEFNNYYGERHFEYYKYPISLDNSDYLSRFEIRSDLAFVLAKFTSKNLWCNKLYLNLNCNCGPYFMKTKLRSLPSSFGPGPICFVVSKLIQMLINKSEKPFKILKLLQASRRNLNSNTDATIPQQIKSKHMQRIRLKAKEKGKYLYRELEICTQLSQLNEYLNELCHKLKCCPRMISFDPVNTCSMLSRKTDNNICIDFKCCIFCTINYFSFYVQQQTLLEQQAKAFFVKHITTQVSKEIAKKPVQIKSKQVHSVADTISTYSPIKTRLNVRQSLLHSLKNQQEVIKKANKTDEYSHASNSRDHSSEPVIKKARKKPQHQQSQHAPPLSQQQPSQQPKHHQPSQDQQHNNEIKIINDLKPSKPLVHTAALASSLNSANVIASQHHQARQVDSSNKSNSLISTANMSNIINCSLNNLNKNINELTQQITSNPLHWSTDEVCKYLLENKFDPNLISLIKEHEIDGQSFLMLNLPTIQNYMNLKLGPAIKLAHLVERLKFNYFQQYQTVSSSSNDK